MNYILFDGDVRNALLPFTYTKPVADIRIGILTIREKWESYLGLTTTTITEEYLEEKNKRDGFGSTTWKWNQMLLGLVIGILFAIINQYVGLKVGMIVSGSWYVAYLSAMALRWSPGEVNLSASASTGASMVCTGFVCLQIGSK